MAGLAAGDGDRTQRLIEELMAGDQEAARRLVERDRNELLRHARYLVRLHGLAHITPDDLHHQGWVQILERGCLERFDGSRPGSFRAFFKQVMRDEAAGQSRSARTIKRGASARGPSLDETAGGGRLRDAVPASDPTPSSHARYDDLLEFCRRLLSAREIGAWTLVEVEGLNAGEAGARLGCSASAVRSLVHRARTKLVLALDEETGS